MGCSTQHDIDKYNTKGLIEISSLINNNNLGEVKKLFQIFQQRQQEILNATRRLKSYQQHIDQYNQKYCSKHNTKYSTNNTLSRLDAVIEKIKMKLSLRANQNDIDKYNQKHSFVSDDLKQAVEDDIDGVIDHQYLILEKVKFIKYPMEIRIIKKNINKNRFKKMLQKYGHKRKESAWNQFKYDTIEWKIQGIEEQKTGIDEKKIYCAECDNNRMYGDGQWGKDRCVGCAIIFDTKVSICCAKCKQKHDKKIHIII